MPTSCGTTVMPSIVSETLLSPIRYSTTCSPSVSPRAARRLTRLPSKKGDVLGGASPRLILLVSPTTPKYGSTARPCESGRLHPETAKTQRTQSAQRKNLLGLHHVEGGKPTRTLRPLRALRLRGSICTEGFLEDSVQGGGAVVPRAGVGGGGDGVGIVRGGEGVVDRGGEGGGRFRRDEGAEERRGDEVGGAAHVGGDHAAAAGERLDDH